MDIQLIVNYFMEFYNSSFASMIKILLGVYSIVLTVDIILLLVLRGLGADVRTLLKGADMPVATKGKMAKRWQKIIQRLETGSASQYKIAILEADKFVDEILEGISHKGKNMAEKLEQMNPGQLENIEDLARVHKIRNEIIQNEGFVVDEKTARETVAVYEDVLKSFEFIDS